MLTLIKLDYEAVWASRCCAPALPCAMGTYFSLVFKECLGLISLIGTPSPFPTSRDFKPTISQRGTLYTTITMVLIRTTDTNLRHMHGSSREGAVLLHSSDASPN